MHGAPLRSLRACESSARTLISLGIYSDFVTATKKTSKTVFLIITIIEGD